MIWKKKKGHIKFLRVIIKNMRNIPSSNFEN